MKMNKVSKSGKNHEKPVKKNGSPVEKKTPAPSRLPLETLAKAPAPASKPARPAPRGLTPQTSRELSLNSASHEEVTRSKFFTGEPHKETFAEESFVFPAGYGEDKIVLLVRDPYWLHTYWEVTQEAIQSIRQKTGDESLGRSNVVLRVKDITGKNADAPNTHFDIHVSDGASSWYINITADNRTYCVEVGILDRNGVFHLIARSNSVTAPRAGVSDVFDEQWMTLEDYDRVYALSGGLRNLAASSAELRQQMQERFEASLSSGGLSSMGSGAFGGDQKKRRDFFLIVDAELIVYGRTVPSAHLTIQGKPKKLNGDGTFSARFALPVGNHEIPVTSVSWDGVDKITITPVVVREENR